MEKLHIKATGYRLLLSVPKIKTETDSGIQLVIDEKLEQAAQNRGIVVSVGPDCWNQESYPWCKVGDNVYFSQYAGRSVLDPHTDEVYTIINDTDVICVIDEIEE